MSDHLITGNYVAIPEDTILSTEWTKLTPTTRCVYTTMMAKYRRKGRGADGCVTWSQVELVEATGISLRTINTCIDCLLEKDWMGVYEAGGRWAKGTTYIMNPWYADRQSPKGYKVRDVE